MDKLTPTLWNEAMLLDDFNRSNQNPMTGWTDISGAGMEVLSNQAGVNSPDGSVNDASVWSTQQTADQEVQATLANSPTAGALEFATLVWRLQSTAAYDNTYEAEIDEVSSGTKRLRCFKIVSGVYTQLGSTHSSFSNGDVIVGSAVGTTIQLWQNGNLRVSVTDSAISGAGYIGIGAYNSAAVRWDNFGGGAPYASSTTLAINSGGMFTLNGVERFLLAVSYFDYLYWRTSDIDTLDSQGIACIRVFADWDDFVGARDGTRSIFTSTGELSSNAIVLRDLIRYCDSKGMVVDITILNETSLDYMGSQANLETAITNCINLFESEANVMFDVMNEQNYVSVLQPTLNMANLMLAAATAGPSEILFMSLSPVDNDEHLNYDSGAGDESAVGSVIDGRLAWGMNAVAHHDMRDENWWSKTQTRTATLRTYLDANSSVDVPILFDEPNRHGFTWPNSASEFSAAAKGCKLGGGALWLFHNSGSFDMSVNDFYSTLNATELATLAMISGVVFGQMPLLAGPFAGRLDR